MSSLSAAVQTLAVSGVDGTSAGDSCNHGIRNDVMINLILRGNSYEC